jgi:hypothetical protein
MVVRQAFALFKDFFKYALDFLRQKLQSISYKKEVKVLQV